MVSNLSKKLFINLITILIFFSLDRISKFYVIFQSEKNLSNDLFQSKFLNISLIWNEGIAFGLLSFDDNIYYNIITSVIIIIILVIIWFLNKSKGIEKLCFLMIAGGASGNLFDRIYYAAVPDFIDLSINNYHWFIFNIADIFISVGVIVLIILEFFKKKAI